MLVYLQGKSTPGEPSSEIPRDRPEACPESFPLIYRVGRSLFAARPVNLYLK
ncbi:hypothetical protein V0288_05840 [Pannus brasiliensis CCIBt3594]|uniref:Uncharacterized protein n=1 Tax=Pannus brasiliensis CCIBt3594 TaxID=1427578 RepID=A0AAW9QFW1_9CHRO